MIAFYEYKRIMFTFTMTFHPNRDYVTLNKNGVNAISWET